MRWNNPLARCEPMNDEPLDDVVPSQGCGTWIGAGDRLIAHTDACLHDRGIGPS